MGGCEKAGKQVAFAPFVNYLFEILAIMSIEEEKAIAFKKLEEVIHAAIPTGFCFGELYKMPSWYISLEDYPDGYHCAKNQPLPFLSIANQKSHIALYHMGMYAEPSLLEWFEKSHLEQTGKKADLGKSCIRFKKPGDIPFDLIADLMTRMTAAQWIKLYEERFRKKP